MFVVSFLIIYLQKTVISYENDSEIDNITPTKKTIQTDTDILY